MTLSPLIQDFADRLAREFEEQADLAALRAAPATAATLRSCARRARELAGEGERGEQFTREYRVNDARGIYGPFSREEAEREHRALSESVSYLLRQPVIESRLVSPWRDEEYGEVSDQQQREERADERQ